jgi:hypothetical protein
MSAHQQTVRRDLPLLEMLSLTPHRRKGGHHTPGA